MKLLVCCLSLLGTAAWAGDCSALRGTYAPVSDPSNPPLYSQIEITFTAASSALSVHFNTDLDPSRQRSENYVADGLSHVGDGDETGKTYTASCDGDTLTIRRLGLIVDPIDDTYSLNGNTLKWHQSIEGTTEVREESFSRL